MPSLFPRTVHDTSAPLIVELSDRNGTIDLTGATVTVTMVNDKTNVTKINRASCLVLNQTTAPGQVEYNWHAADVDTAGVFRVQFEVVFPDTTKLTWPPGGQWAQQYFGTDLDAA